MKLSLLTYLIAKSWDLDHILKMARRCGFAGIELRTEAGHAHGVELERTPAERRAIRDRVEDAYLELVGLGTGCRYESPNPAERQAMVDRTKRYIELANDLGSTRVRVFGNIIPAGVRRDDCVGWVGESLRTLGEFGESLGVDVLLEMHGQFNYYGFARAAVEIADHPNVALVYNCDTRDMVGGSVAAVYSQVRDLIRHVHMHEFLGPYPYPELIGLLDADGYDGYFSSEIEVERPTPEHYLAVYASLFRAWAGLPFYGVPDND
ncbi:MAG: sugar phosphate isomerase/epimerase family protein [Chloroflexota bacterium]